MSTEKVMQALELEPALGNGELNGNGAHHHQNEPKARSPIEFCQSLWALIVAYALYYRTVSIMIFVVAFIVVVVVLLDAVAYHATSKTRYIPSSSEVYSELQSVYDSKVAKIDHWCLQGDDYSCRCNDPTEPMSRGEIKGWAKAHRLNKELIDNSAAAMLNMLDVVFLGDEVIEEWNGRWLARPAPDGMSLSRQWNKTFTKDGGGDVDGLALGVAGDYISSVLWRLKHGEMPITLEPKVWWILIGANDLSRMQCSEEAVVLGILRLAEEVKTQHPDSVVVVNSILPRMPESSKKKKKRHAKNKPLDVWPSIQVVNQVLETYCSKHGNLVFSDATPLFFSGSPRNKGRYEASKFLTPLMPDRTHLSVAGHKVWGKAIVEKLKEIIYEDEDSS